LPPWLAGPDGAAVWEEPFRIRIGGAAGLRPSRDPPAALTAYHAKTPTAAVFLRVPNATVK